MKLHWFAEFLRVTVLILAAQAFYHFAIGVPYFHNTIAGDVERTVFQILGAFMACWWIKGSLEP